MPARPTYEGVIKIRGKGTGFIALDDFAEDVLVTNEHLNCALNGDLVEVELMPQQDGQRQSGAVKRVLERAHTELVGTVERTQSGDCVLRPDHKHIHVTPQLAPDACTHAGQKVAAALEPWTDPHTQPRAVVREVLGPAGAHETEMQAIIRSGGFAVDFPPDVAAAAKHLHETRAEIFASALQDPARRDMREVPTMTIDPADAKDFDDALSLRDLGDGTYEVGIHIADVSHYVTPGDPIDEEAKERGTSIYLVDRVIPMLPEILSNDLCSLRPHEDRLAFSAVYTLDRDGAIMNEWYGQTVIHSDKRFSYEEAQAVLDEGRGPFLNELRALQDIARSLRKKRFAKGAIAFESEEVKFELDADGTPLRVYTKERTETMMMVEDFMLLANRTVATHIHTLAKARGRDAAFIYRVHDTPDPDKIEELATFLHALGYEFKNHRGVVDAKEINELLAEVADTPEENLIKTATVRAMAKAVYSTKNIGHFGLAFKYYTHFTSPIRRYPDLIAHRLLRRHLDGEPISAQEIAKFEKISVQSSEREMEAVRAERDSIKYKQVEYMQDKIGQEFRGVITGVTDWGIYVEESQSKAEGMIRLAALKNDYFAHDPSQYHVKGQHTGTAHALGDEVTVKLVGVNKEDKQLDFALVANHTRGDHN